MALRSRGLEELSSQRLSEMFSKGLHSQSPDQSKRAMMMMEKVLFIPKEQCVSSVANFYTFGTMNQVYCYSHKEHFIFYCLYCVEVKIEVVFVCLTVMLGM